MLKYGDEGAFRLACMARNRAVKSGIAVLKSSEDKQSDHVLVVWDPHREGWHAIATLDTVQKSKFFPVKLYGEEEALRLAEAESLEIQVRSLFP